MKFKNIIISSSPSIILLLGLIFFAYSPLTIDKLVTIQNEIVMVFMEGLSNDLSLALSNTFSYLWSNVLVTMIVFLSIVCIGFLVNALLLKEIEFKIMIVSDIILVGLIYVLTNFSIMMLLTAVGLLLGSIWVYKTFEEKKNNFSTGFSFVSSRLKMMSLFLVIGVFLAVFLNMSSYEQKINESNMELITSLVPDVSAIQDAQKMLVTQMSEGFQSSVEQEYESMTPEERTDCKSMRNNLIRGINNYEEDYKKQVDEQEIDFDQSQIFDVFPAFNVIANMSPIFAAFSVYILLSLLTPIASVFCGIAYSVMKKMGKRTKSTVE